MYIAALHITLLLSEDKYTCSIRLKVEGLTLWNSLINVYFISSHKGRLKIKWHSSSTSSLNTSIHTYIRACTQNRGVVKRECYYAYTHKLFQLRGRLRRATTWRVILLTPAGLVWLNYMAVSLKNAPGVYTSGFYELYRFYFPNSVATLLSRIVPLLRKLSYIKIMLIYPVDTQSY